MYLNVQHMSKQYGRQKALDHVSFHLKPGIYGILGPNGAGKSTLMNILTGNLRADQGQIFINDQKASVNDKHYKDCLGYVPQQQALYPEFSVRQFLGYVSALRGLDKAETVKRTSKVLEMVNLSEVINRRISALSGGMKQRLLIAQALLHEPQLLILDKPTAGLDPQQRVDIRNLISQIAQERIVLIATHIVSDIECIADEILLMDKGHLICQKEYRQLLEELEGKVWEVSVEKTAFKNFQEHHLISKIRQERSRFLFIYEMHANNQEGYSPADMAAVYRQMTAEGADQPQETEVWLRQKIIQIEEGRLDESWELYNSVLEQTESINSYGDYWSSLMSGGNSISVLFANESSYSGRNIARTRQAYQHLQGLAVKAECSAGILAVIGTGASDLLVLGFVFCLLLILVPREKEEGYHRLTIPMKLGGSDQAAAKYLILIAAAVLMTGICFGMNCLLAQLTVGLGNPGRSIQSVYGCQTCPYSFCVGDYLIVCLIAKCVGMAAVMSIFFLLAIIGDGMLQAAVSAAAFLAFSFLLWSGISPHSWLNILHYFNLIHLLDTQAVLGDYRNINLAGYPVNQIIICMVLAGISIPCSAVIGCRMFGSSSKIRISLRHSAQTMPNSIMKHRIQPKHLSGFERYKLLAANGGLALLILLSAVSIILTRREPLFMNSQTAIYENYCRQIEGKLSPEKLEFIEQEKSKFDEGRLNMPEQHAALDQVYKQYLKLEERKKAGLEVAFFSQSGWEG